MNALLALQDFEEVESFERIKTKAIKRKSESKKVVRRTTTQIENAVWQYLIDHASLTKDGYAVSFLAKSKDDFLRRVEARRTGEFKRVDQSKVEREIKKIKRTGAWVDRRQQAYAEARKSGPWWLQLALTLRKKLTVFIDHHSMKRITSSN